jgi:hypothetical protein
MGWGARGTWTHCCKTRTGPGPGEGSEGGRVTEGNPRVGAGLEGVFVCALGHKGGIEHDGPGAGPYDVVYQGPFGRFRVLRGPLAGGDVLAGLSSRA